MALSQNYAAVATVGAALLQSGDASRLSPVNFGTVFTPNNGTANAGGQVERIMVEAVGTMPANVLRLYRWDGTMAHLFYEGAVSALAASGAAPITPSTMQAVDNPTLFPILVPPGWTLRASIQETALAQDGTISSIAASQTTAAAGPILLNGTSATAASAASVAALAASTAGVPMTLTGTTAAMAVPSLLAFTSPTNVSSVSFKVIGRSPSGALATEVVVGPNTNTVVSAGIYRSVAAIIPNSTNAGTMSVGTPSAAGLSALPLPSPVMLTSGGNLSALNFTITGMSPAGAVLTEVLAGPNAGFVLSANTYASVFIISASAAVTGAVMVGTPPILSGIKVFAEGGSY